MQLSDLQARTPTWCPGCGDHGIWAALKNSVIKLNWEMHNFVFVYGIGCSGNMTDFIKSHGFHSLHGRSIPNAIGIKLANHELKVVCVVGDGDCYGEGGNHLLHAVRGNHDICVIVHDNRIYGLTTGQASPTSPKGFKSKSTPAGVIEQPLNALALAVMQGASFVAQGFAGDVPHLSQIIEKALQHKGFGLVNILQPCVTFNKLCTYQFFQERVYKLEQSKHDVTNKKLALQVALFDGNKIPIGILFQEQRIAYHEEVTVLKSGPLAKTPVKTPDLNETLNTLK